jgi:hypothetical protein
MILMNTAVDSGNKATILPVAVILFIYLHKRITDQLRKAPPQNLYAISIVAVIKNFLSMVRA